MSEQQKNQSAALRASCLKLIASKHAERQLVEIKDLILAAPAHGISDKELIREIKKAYPEIKLTPKKLKELRARWATETLVAPPGEPDKNVSLPFPPLPGRG